MPKLTKTFRYKFQQKTEPVKPEITLTYDTSGHQPEDLEWSWRHRKDAPQCWKYGGPVHMEAEDLGQVRIPALVGYPIYPYNLFISSWSRLHVRRSTVPRQPALGQPVRVNGASVVREFSSCESCGNWVSRLNVVIKSLRKARQTHSRTTWLPTARSVASYFRTTSPPTRKWNWRCWPSKWWQIG